MKLLRAVRPALVRRQVLTRLPPPSRPMARAWAPQPVQRQYSSSSPPPSDIDYSAIAAPASDGVKFIMNPRLAEAHGRTAEMEPLRDTLSYTWLRDSCTCPLCVNQDTMQRNFAVTEIPPDIHAPKINANSRGLQVEWSDGHQSEYDWDFLMTYLYSGFRTHKGSGHRLWGKNIEEDRPPVVDYDAVMKSDETLGRMTSLIASHGFVLVEKTPYEDPNDTKKLLERIAFIRETHYGGFYDFKPDLAMADTAYTNQPLRPHTDTTYFSDPAGLQSFHMLSHEAAGPGEEPSGGRSILVDGFNAARVLQNEDPAAYYVLSNHRIPWHASGNKGINIAPDRLYPVLQVKRNFVQRIRWNDEDRGVIPLRLDVHVDWWYAAARKWSEILERPGMQFSFQLKPGTVLIFDNWRVLHGRTGFTGIRRICGGYINRDDFISRWRNLNFSQSEIMKKVRG